MANRINLNCIFAKAFYALFRIEAHGFYRL